MCIRVARGLGCASMLPRDLGCASVWPGDLGSALGVGDVSSGMPSAVAASAASAS